jgi:hypothetical protein
MLKTPILFVIFNRYDTSLQVFNAIREMKPEKLYVSADGPRSDKLDDKEKCQKTRDIIKLIDWECELHTNFLDENLGCHRALPCAIDWFFEHNEMGIILEDDCLPSKSFFGFCETMLNLYKDDTRIMHITGDNFLDEKIIEDGSYYFSNLPFIWGWATWKRAWAHYDRNFSTFPKFKKQNQIKNIFNDPLVQLGRIYHYNKIFSKRGVAWDFAWSYSVCCQNGLCITPNKNLITNLGFGEGAVHCHNKIDRYSKMKRYEIEEITHPAFVIPNKEADLYTLRNHHKYSIPGIISKIFDKFISYIQSSK